MDTISLASLGMVMETLEEGVLFLDEQRNIVAINPSAAHMIGREHDDIVGKSCPTVFPGTPCARICEESGKCSLMEGTLEGDKLVQDFVVARPDGGLVPLHMWATALPMDESLAHCNTSGGIFRGDRYVSCLHPNCVTHFEVDCSPTVFGMPRASLTLRASLFSER